MSAKVSEQLAMLFEIERRHINLLRTTDSYGKKVERNAARRYKRNLAREARVAKMLDNMIDEIQVDEISLVSRPRRRPVFLMYRRKR